MYIGEAYEAKILGCFCLIDQGEVDWKVLIVDSE
jgi:inorganic pyrophosphatase